jgi:hypothetical protein
MVAMESAVSVRICDIGWPSWRQGAGIAPGETLITRRQGSARTSCGKSGTRTYRSHTATNSPRRREASPQNSNAFANSRLSLTSSGQT